MAPPDLPARPDRKDYARDDRSAQEYPRKERDRAGVNDRARGSAYSDRPDDLSGRDRDRQIDRRDAERWERLRGTSSSGRGINTPSGREKDMRDTSSRPDVQSSYDRRPASSSRGERPPAPTKTPPQQPHGPGLAGASGVLGDLRRLAQEKMAAEQAARKQAAERLLSPEDLDEGMEEGETEAGEVVGQKRRSPIVWRTPPKVPKLARDPLLDDENDEHRGDPEPSTLERPASRADGRIQSPYPAPEPSPLTAKRGPMTAAERAAAELEEFAAQAHADLDRNAPPAIKSSPSVSGGEDDMHDDGGEAQMPKKHAISSRWLDEELEEEPAPTSEPIKADVDGGAALAEEELNARERQELASGASPGGQESDDDGLRGPAGPGSMRQISMLHSCRPVEEFNKLNRISEGTYGVVYRARDKTTGRICALKKVRMEKEKDGFPLTSIREINILLSFHHPNIVDVKEVVVGRKLDDIFMVMEYVEHDLKALTETMSKPFTVSEVKCLMRQLFDGMAYLHDNWVLHRDLKTSNILYSNRGELKICDFGLARQYGSPLRPYTHNVVTLWYRAPELLLGTAEYSTAIDMWSLGCIMAELLSRKVLFNGQSEIEQVNKIFTLLGTPTDESWPGHKKLKVMERLNLKPQPFNRLRERFPPPSSFDFEARGTLSDEGFKLLNGLLQLNPAKRITAQEALDHRWFKEHPLPKEQALMPTFPEKDRGGAEAPLKRAQRLQPSPDPRIPGVSASGFAARAAEIGSLFEPARRA